MCDCEVCFWVCIAMQPFVFSKVVEEFRMVLLEIDGEIRAGIVFAKCMVLLVISDVNIYLCLQGLTCGLDLGGFGLVLGRCGLLWVFSEVYSTHEVGLLWFWGEMTDERACVCVRLGGRRVGAECHDSAAYWFYHNPKSIRSLHLQ